MKLRSVLSTGRKLQKLAPILAALSGLGAATTGCSHDRKPPEWRAPESMPWRQRIDQEWSVVDEYVGQAVRDRKIIGAEVALVTPEGWSARGFGWATAQTQPNELTVYEIGSVSKVFTGTMLADMVLRREVTLVQPAQALLPSGVTMPRSATRPITLMDLSTHMSGMPRLPPTMRPKNKKDPYADFDTADLYAALGKTRLDAEPGVESEYSNYAVGLLGQLLVNRADVTDYDALLRQRIVGPLGMNDTSVVVRGDQEARYAWGHEKDNRRTPHWFIPGLAGAGGIRSTARDMAVFVQAIMRPDSPISAAAREALVPRGTPKNGDWDQGLGWVVRRDRTMAWHNGATGGFHTYVGIDLATSVGIVVLCNTQLGEIDSMGVKVLKKVKRSIGTGPIANGGASPYGDLSTAALDTSEMDESDAAEIDEIGIAEMLEALRYAALDAGDEVAAR